MQDSPSLVYTETNMEAKEMKKDWRWECNGMIFFFFYLKIVSVQKLS